MRAAGMPRKFHQQHAGRSRLGDGGRQPIDELRVQPLNGASITAVVLRQCQKGLLPSPRIGH
jgi:hypothetical protein